MENERFHFPLAGEGEGDSFPFTEAFSELEITNRCWHCIQRPGIDDLSRK